MNNGCNRWSKINQLHLVLSATLILVFCLCFGGKSLTASAATLPEIQQRGYVNIAVKYNLRPLGFKDDNGNLQGLEIDLARRLAEELLGKPDAVRFKSVANSDRLSVILNNQVDLTIARVTATESRSRIVSFSVPYYIDGAAIVTKDTSIQKLQDLSKRKIAVLNNSSTIARVRYFIPNAELVGVNSYVEAREKIENNTADAFAADTSVLSGWVQEYPQYRLLPTKLSAQPLSVVMPKGLQYDELRRKVNEAIARYTATGWLKERAQFWGLFP
ncbi:transporter substrate-binding domain-containing protein [Anabaena cylindrica FACHB-243]|uniref:Amino acid ABC transporter substrate-binding protein, PAAT family n=1 Tax=Anabaena cylindrica (strain ATCC 27899 / PCC 7122) TaxID=272123 RepID=K9ZMG6_ANACC|nr:MULTISPECIES: transporter substrate-binding domain-containing protein [Anabaena]AFZ60396.1 amino acid ABC transporter substrate-binding protein, PAAT family [Anabaena cylindrica PCC 7122]MBD2416384.1 transporter substrate-binding domain-containing protein [Anabaena cylindrica FACHB-243]MBY5285093.1 transporter substrate-binding domain-containing protein [Anabaena sp. CCAP 1446/1C]MBY5308763.1 transporter substrate-binding domain-containing protein [Anabaena sp. CCAP 1446/1C]MCM2408437.1 tra